jgi:hypothetical protein
MASSLIGALRVSLGLDTAQFEAGAKKASGIAKREAGAMETSFKSAKTAAEGLFAAFAVGALAEQIKKSLDYAGSLKEVSRTLGLTTKDLQTFRFAATQSGVAQDQLEVGLRRLTVTIGKAELGSKAQIEAFKAVGISVDQLKGKTTGDVFRLLSDGLSKVTDRAQRAAVEMILMGRSGSTLDNLLAPGSRRLNELAQAAQELGIVLSDQQIQGAEETAHKLEALKEVLSAQIAGIVANNANAILQFANALATLTSQIIRFLGSNPSQAYAILGGLIGLRLGGVGGLLAGGLVGGIIGGQQQQQTLATSNDLTVRRQQLAAAQANLTRIQREGPTTTTFFENGIPITTTADRTKELAAAVRNVREETQKLNRAVATSKAPPPITPPGTNLPQFLGGGDRRGRTRREPADRSDEVLAQFHIEQLQAERSILQAKQQLEGSADERAKLELQLIDIDKQIQDAQIDERVNKAARELAEHKITQAAFDQVKQQGAILKADADRETQIRLQAFAEEQARKKQQALFDIADQQREFAIDGLKAQDDLATTAADKRRIELQILDLEIEEKRLRLQQNLELARKNGATAEQLQAIQDQIDHLPAEHTLAAAAIGRNTENPLAQWQRQVPKTAAEINEALQSIEVKGLDGLSEAISGVITGTESLKSAFHQLAASILQDLIQMTIKMLIFKALQAALGGGGIGSPGAFDANSVGVAGAGAFSPSTSIGSAAAAIPGFATGGSIYVGGRSGTDQNMLQLNGIDIAKVSYGERINIANDDSPMQGAPSVSLTLHNDFRGVDASSVARIQTQLDAMKAELPARVLATMGDARDRFVWKGR